MAAIIRADLKKKFPAYRFSVDSKKRDGMRQITISLIESPLEITNKRYIAAYLEPANESDMFFDPFMLVRGSKNSIMAKEKENIITEIYRHSRCYFCVDIIDGWIMPEIFEALMYAQKQMQQYNR
ncbi:MAG: LPD29 domain-containing protein [Treponema sp.]